MEINKVQWRMIAKGEKLPCDSFLMKKDGTIPSVISSAGVEIGQDAYYLPVEELRSFPKEESEDERIRKELIAEVKEQIDCIPVPDCRDKEDEKALKQLNKWLAWLEKQAEQKPVVIIPKFRVGDEIKTSNEGSLTITKIDENGYWSEDLFICDFDEECLWDLVEQKPTEEYNITGIKSKHAQGKLGEMIKRKLEMEKQGEQILANSCKTCKDEQKPWSEEDETKLTNTIIMLKEGASLHFNKKDITKAVDWLKSLRPQSHWKPSDEQMVTLEYYMHTLVCNSYKETLFSLYQDLKKLREE